MLGKGDEQHRRWGRLQMRDLAVGKCISDGIPLTLRLQVTGRGGEAATEVLL